MNKSALKNATTGLAGAVALAGGSQAYGAVVSVAVPANITSTNALGTPKTEFYDVNGDGTPDFQLTCGVNTTYKAAYAGISGAYQAYNAFGFENKVVGYAGAYANYASRLAAGTVVGSSSAFVYGQYLTVLGSRFSGKNYGALRTQGFVGFEFEAADGLHFGYINLKATVSGSTAANLSATLNFYSAAYESTPNTPITIPGAVPEPTSLAALAFGGAGLAGAAAYRRKKAAKQPVKNDDLWRALVQASAPHRIEWQWVKGHAGHPDNERADRLACAAAEAARR